MEEETSLKELKKILYEKLVLLLFKKEPELLRDLSSSLIEYPFPVVNKQIKERNRTSKDDAVCVLNKLFNWKIAIANHGKLIAVLQENILEIRSSRDEFVSPFCQINIDKDASPELRKVAWSPDSSMIALCYSTGNISVFNIRGVNAFNIPCREEDGVPINLFFMDIRTKSTQSSYELILLYRTGLLKSYKVASDMYQEFHKFQFPVPYPVTDFIFDSTHKLFYISYAVNFSDKNPNSSNSGLVIWRLLTDQPYYKLAIPDKIIYPSVSYFKFIINIFSTTKDNYIFRMKASPMGSKLACLHTCGSLSIWSLPSLIFMKKHLLANPSYDINWWDEDHLVVCSHDKYLTIHHYDTFVNNLGDNGEHLEGVVTLPSPKQDNCLLMLEHNFEFIKRGGEDDGVLQEFEYQGGFLWKMYLTIKSASMSMFEMGSTPKKKKSRVVKSMYRLLAIKSITPEELLTRKINKEEYEEALVLAKTYRMDTDRVYQRQWRYAPVSSYSIQNYLNKITKRLWVLHECCERVPESLKAAKELIEFGLQASHISAVLNEDTSLSMEADNYDVKNENIEATLKRLSNMKLTPEQSELIQMRKQLLNFSDKLFTYEMIIGGPGVADEAYEKDKYDKFRLQSVGKSAVEFARSSNARAVEHILTFHGDQVLPYWLHFLDNFPEICDPKVYRDLLPECSPDGTPHMWGQKNLRDKDWCELKWGCYTDEIDMSVDSVENFTKEILVNWYEKRAKAIVERSGLVEVSIELVQIASEKNITGLESLHADLLTLESIVYAYDDELSYMSLGQLQSIDHVKQMILLTSKKEHAFLTDLRKKIIPYLTRIENMHGTDYRKTLVLNYFKQLSADSIVFVYLLVKHFPWTLLCENANELSLLVVESVFACRNNEPDQYEKINESLTLVTHKDVSVDVLNQLKHLDAVLACSNILQRYNMDYTWEFVFKNKTNADIANEILSKAVDSIQSHMSPFDIQFVHNLLEDLRVVQARLFQCVPIQDVYRKYVHGLLLSKNIHAIQHCESMISTTRHDKDKLLSFEDSVNFVLEAARKYINVSISIQDDNLTLARICLKLIKEKSAEIQGEMSLILAMHVLHGFNVKLVPLGIRNFEKNSVLLDKCLQQRGAYRRVNQLQELCDYLNIFEPPERHTKVLCRAVETALQHNDVHFAVEKCLTIVKKEEAQGWRVCYELACRSDLTRLDIRHKLLTFALNHSDPDYLIRLLELKAELRYASVNSTVDSLDQFHEADDSSEASSPSLFSVSQFLSLSATTSFWKSVFHLQQEELEDQHLVESFDEFSVDEFYSDLHETCTCVDKDCAKLYTSHFLNLNLALRLNIDNNCAYDEALVTCARMVLGVDAALALQYLLCVQDVTACEDCFNDIPLTQFSCRAALLCFALYELKRIDPKVVHLPPHRVIDVMKKLVSEPDLADSVAVRLFLTHAQYEEQFTCIEQLKQFECGVDERRFITDVEYRRDTVLGLAMSDSEKSFSLALSLAEKYRLDLYEIVKQHALALLTRSNTPLKLQESVIKESCAHVLTPDVLSRFTKEIFDTLPGTNHQSLMALFKFVQSFDTSPPISLATMTVKDIIKLLIKVTVTSPGIDFKLLLDGHFLESVDSILNESTIQPLTRLLKSLPPHLKARVNLSSVYQRLLMKNLSNYQLSTKTSTEDKPLDELVEFFKKCTTYLSKMETPDLTHFLKHMIFSDRFAVTINSRGRVVTLAMQYLQQNVDQNSWPTLKESLAGWQEHIRRVKQLHTIMPVQDAGQSKLLEEILRLPMTEDSLDAILSRAVQLSIIPDSKYILTVMKC